MDYELMTMWLSVDPMADKYPSISPYAYCAWNPVMIIDPDGDSLRLDGTNEQREMILNYLHQYSHLSFQYDENGYVTINTELPGSEIKDKTDSYISDMITDQSNISVIKLINQNDEMCNSMNSSLGTKFGGNKIEVDGEGKITRVEGTQYLCISIMETICHNSMTHVSDASKYPGLIIMHEFSEGYEGCRLSRKLGRPLSMVPTDYNITHARANTHFFADFERVETEGSPNIKIKIKSQYINLP